MFHIRHFIGMQDMNRVREVYNMVKLFHTNFAILHCTSSYPTYPEDVNLRVIQTFQEEFPDISIGYSGHELGIVISIAAVSLGASVIFLLLYGNKYTYLFSYSFKISSFLLFFRLLNDILR